jgi:hypothetical protein
MIKNMSRFNFANGYRGAEYASLLATPLDILSKFRIMVIEFHDIEIWSQQHFLNIVELVFEKI